MKSTINFYYNLFPEEIVSQDEFFYFWINENKFYFVPFKNDKEQVMEIYEKLLHEKKKVNKIILNKEGNLVTNFKNSEYALFLVDCLENEIVDIKDFYIILMEKENINWGGIWERKIDYFEYQVNQRALGKENILNSFSYYVGLGENAIEYYNLIDKNNVSVGIQHKRIGANNYEINYYNPLNMVIDYSVRDIAEYIKFAFFNDKLNVDKVINYINSLNLTSAMMNLLYVRLLFPTYYFDHYERLINKEEDERVLINIIGKAKDYELFLKKYYLYYEKEYNLLKIDWLFK